MNAMIMAVAVLAVAAAVPLLAHAGPSPACRHGGPVSCPWQQVEVGTIRGNGKTIAAIENMKSDSAAAGDDFHAQAMLLNKINGASVLELRISETTNQFLMHMLEQLLVQNKRTRDAEAELMDAHLFQWR